MLVCARSYLYNNQLSGSIPSSLGSLTELVQLCVRLRLLFALNCAEALRLYVPAAISPQTNSAAPYH